MKTIIALSSLVFLFACKTNKKEIPATDLAQYFFVGTYTGEESQGIYKYALHPDGTMDSLGLAAVTPNPSFLARSADNRYLLAISEVSKDDKTGRVRSYAIKDDSLVFISESTSGGAHPCFVTVNASGFVIVANYTGGNVALLQLNEQGYLSDLLDLEQHIGSGTTDRQKGPHAHSAWFVPGSEQVISVDLGTNELWLSRLDQKTGKLVPADPSRLPMNAGAGPRHLAFHPNGKWIYVVNELDCTVSLVKDTESGYILEQSVSTLPGDFEGRNTCADIHVASDGRFLYASNRGHNSIAVFSIAEENGSLAQLGHVATHGSTPRNFSLSPGEDFLLVANQDSNNIVSFRRNEESGMLEFIKEIYAPRPVCIRF